MFANIWNWILSIVGSAFLLWQVIIVIALVVSGIACIIYVIWKLILYVAEKSGGPDSAQKDKEHALREGKKYWDNIINPKPKSKWNRTITWIKTHL